MANRKVDDLENVKRKRLVLSIDTKMQILKKLDEGCCVKNLSDTYHVGLSTIYDIKKQKTDILKFYSDADHPNLLSNRKTMHQAKNEDVDKVLMEWIRQRRLESFPLNRNIIMAQAKKIHGELKLEKNCDYSHGWFNRFKQRHGLKLLKISDERAAADTESAENYVDYVMELVQNEKNLETNSNDLTTAVEDKMTSHDPLTPGQQPIKVECITPDRDNETTTGHDSPAPEQQSIKVEVVTSDDDADNDPPNPQQYPASAAMIALIKPEPSTDQQPPPSTSMISLIKSEPPTDPQESPSTTAMISLLQLPPSQSIASTHNDPYECLSIAVPNPQDSTSTARSKKKTRADSDNDSRLSAEERVKRPRNSKIDEDRFDVFGKNVACKLREMEGRQRILVEKIINDALFEAEMGNLTTNHKLVNIAAQQASSFPVTQQYSTFVPFTTVQCLSVNSESSSPQQENNELPKISNVQGHQSANE